MPLSSPLDDVVAGAVPGAIAYGAPLSPDQIARQAGFRTTPAPALAPRDTYAIPLKGPRINPATGTTELIPGGFDVIENMLKQLVSPTRAPITPGGGVRG